MGLKNRLNRGLVFYSSRLAEYIASKEVYPDPGSIYDIRTLDELDDEQKTTGVFANLCRFEEISPGERTFYRICLQDNEIIRFLETNREVDSLTFMIFVLLHELVHMHRFEAGKADFDTYGSDEEVIVDTLTRVLLSKHPVPGRRNVLTLLDKVRPAPLYNLHIFVDQGGSVNAYL